MCETALRGLCICGRRPTWDRCFTLVARWTASGVFAFVGSQHLLEIGGQDWYVDLLLYHRRLRCLVAIDLKIGALPAK
jgi:hypothetical protein